MLRQGEVGFAAEGADGAVVKRAAAIGALALQPFAADGAEPPADRILDGTVGLEHFPAIDFIGQMRRTADVRAKAAALLRGLSPRARGLTPRWLGAFGFRSRQLDRKLGGQAFYYFVVKLGAVALLEHRKRRLLAADFRRQFALRDSRRLARIANLQTKSGVEIDHAIYKLIYRVINSC